ncbi:MAG TPA: phenylalanine--tRNA ligase subunit beta [Gemmatimonadaceae bacterium]
MNASYDWLQSIVPTSLSPEALRDLITSRCCTVDELVRLREDLRDVVVGLVVEAAPHPDSDHLWVTRVDAGRGELLDVVCGAPNVRAGHKYPFAPAGSTLPGGLKLEKRKIRGAVSNGMLCSARELGLGQDHAGILELDTSAAPGTPFLAAAPVGDVRLVLDVTPNRPDLLSHLGIAREIAAATGVPLALPPVRGAEAVTLPAAEVAPRSARAANVTVVLEDPEGCTRYMGAVVRGVRVGPSPDWLVERITAVGGRSVNNVVDVTNYLLHELGQPMHAFDADRLAGAAVIVRRARAGEKLVTLDGVERTLESSMTVIADGDRAAAVAGVMGGAESEVGESTTSVFLEVATFDPSSVRRTRRALGLSTDASYRFERGVDPDLPPRALERAVRMLAAVAGGRLDGAPVDLYPSPRPRTRLVLRTARVERVLGVRVDAGEIARLLDAVGFETEPAEGSLSVTVPGWRPDVTSEIDLVEEVARLRGYDSFPDEVRPFRPGTVPDSPVELVTRRVRERLVSLGLLEARPLPFVRGGDESHVRVANPLSENEAHLRREVLESLARRAEYNLAHMSRDVRLFEVGATFAPSRGVLPREELRAGVVIMGHRRPPHWTEVRPPDFDEWDAKGVGEELARAAFPGAAVELRPGGEGGERLWEIVVSGEPRGDVRRLVLDAPVWAAPAFGVELLLMEIPSDRVAEPGKSRHVPERERLGVGAGVAVRYRPLPTTPASEFDLALLVPNDMPAERVERVLRTAAGELLERVVLFDEYRGENVPPGFRSLAWRLTFRHPERTLREKEIAGRREKLVRTLEGELGVRQRTS